jgi:hypothetical protein
MFALVADEDLPEGGMAAGLGVEVEAVSWYLRIHQEE